MLEMPVFSNTKMDQLGFVLQVPQLIPLIWVELFKWELKADYDLIIIIIILITFKINLTHWFSRPTYLHKNKIHVYGQCPNFTVFKVCNFFEKQYCSLNLIMRLVLGKAQLNDN